MMRQKIELAVIKTLLAKLAKAGFILHSIDFSGGERPRMEGDDVERVRGHTEALKLLLNIDDGWLNVRRDGKFESVRFVFKNEGWDVISDYICGSGPFEAIMESMTQLCLDENIAIPANCNRPQFAWQLASGSHGACIKCGSDHEKH
jgi:hypothetical protein